MPVCKIQDTLKLNLVNHRADGKKGTHLNWTVAYYINCKLPTGKLVRAHVFTSFLIPWQRPMTSMKMRRGQYHGSPPTQCRDIQTMSVLFDAELFGESERRKGNCRRAKISNKPTEKASEEEPHELWRAVKNWHDWAANRSLFLIPSRGFSHTAIQSPSLSWSH